jgi:hypothetical protein
VAFLQRDPSKRTTAAGASPIMPSMAFDPSLLRRHFPDGVAAAAQLVATGIPERTVYDRCRPGGPWQLVLPGVVLLFTGTPTRDQLVLAAQLLCGPRSVVTGLEACRRHGLRRGPGRVEHGREDARGEVHLLVPHDRQIRSVGYVHAERTRRLPDPLVRRRLRLAPIARACMDAARRLRIPGDVTELLADPVQRGLCTVESLVTELGLASRRGTAVPRRVLSDIGLGVRSAAERAAKQLWPRTGLPSPWWNAALHGPDGRLLAVVDCWLDDVAMAWEIESTEWHLSPADHDRTVHRAALLVAAGVAYTATKPRRLTSDADGVVEILRATYARAAARPRPPLTAVPHVN